MKPSLFISYSRREAPFADSLLDELEDREFNVWLDTHNLVPGRPWDKQINQGIEKSEVFLFIVSKESISSGYAEDEWRRGLQTGKRLILIIFEAVPLPPELAGCEWVDMRVSFKAGLRELLQRLESSPASQPPPPQAKFRAPRLVWLSVAVSLGVALISLLALWTVYVPYVLLPLPIRILKRDFNFLQMQTALFILPFALIATGLIVVDDDLSTNIILMAFASVLPVLILYLLLRSPGMQRWGKPIATLAKFANPFNPNIKNPEPTPFLVEAAAEDKKYADEIIKVMTRYGHPLVERVEEAKAAFILISTYKQTTDCNPETQLVYPIILQSAKKIDSKIRRIQWIDFRRGLKDLDEIAQLLPEPSKLLKALGISPMGSQQTLPPVIQRLVTFLWLLAIFSIGSLATYFFQFAPELSASLPVGETIFLGLTLLIFIASIIVTVRSLTTRRGFVTTPKRFIGAMLLLGFLIALQFISIILLEDTAGIALDPDDFRGMGLFGGPLVYVLGLITVAPMTLRYWHVLRRWFPARRQAGD